MRSRRSSRSRGTLIAMGVIGGIAGGSAGVWLTQDPVSTCFELFDGRNPPSSTMFVEEHCIALVDPFVAESNTQELAVPPGLLNDPSDSVRRLHALVGRLDSAVSGVATVRFRVTEGGAVNDPRVVESSGHEALDDAIAAIATSFEFSPGSTSSGPVEVPMEYVVGFRADTRSRLLRWLSAIRT